MGKDRVWLFEDLKRTKHACTLMKAEAALRAWKFTEGRSKGHARVWNYGHVTLTLHTPHGRSGKNMDPRAVAMVIRKIEEAAVLQLQEEEANATD
ncbi:MAG: hypothetical protein ACLGI9_23785 [Thermoanaerobaculia bacterium]